MDSKRFKKGCKIYKNNMFLKSYKEYKLYIALYS